MSDNAGSDGQRSDDLAKKQFGQNRQLLQNEQG